MYNLGVEGDDSLLYVGQPENTDKCTSYDDEDSCSRGEEHSSLFSSLTTHLLRIGLSLQCASLILMILFYFGFGGSGIFVFDIYSGPESVKLNNAFHLCISLLTGVYLIGSIYIALFQVFVADNSKWTRGFRIGSKLLSSAVMLDILSMSLRLIQYFYAYFFMSMKWWNRYNQSKADWSLFNFGNVVNSFALFLYGFAWFHLEAYHDEGTYEEYAWIHLALFSTAGLSELLMVFTGYGSFFTLLLLSAMISSTFWAFIFEPLLENWTPELHSRDVNTDVEAKALENTVSEGFTGGSNYDHTTSGYGGGEPREDTYASAEGQWSRQPYAFNNAMANIPTSYDYSQFNRQVSSGIEAGVIS